MLSPLTSEQQSEARLRELRPLLLKLHKALMDQERMAYEETHGAITSRGEYFQLVLEHEWFSWLRPISQLIVRIDERLSPRSSSQEGNAAGLIAEVSALFSPAPTSTHSAQRYEQAIQNNAEIALMHVSLTQLLTQS